MVILCDRGETVDTPVPVASLYRKLCMGRRYTKEILAPLVQQNTSMAGVLRDLGVKQAGGTQTHITRKVREYGLDTVHFHGQGSNKGTAHKGGPGKTPWLTTLSKKDTGRRTAAYRLRRALLDSGRPYACESCGIEGVWVGKPLMLQVDHINRDWLDNRPENLRFLCPNCHSQQPGWCNSKGLTSVTKQEKG